MATPPEPAPEAPAVGFNLFLELRRLGMTLRFRCSTGVVVILGVAGVTLGAIFGREEINPVVQSICNAVFGTCTVTEGSIVVDVDCFTVARVKELLDSHKCGNLKRKFLEEVQMIRGMVKDLKIKFEVQETLELNEDRNH
ncbi:Hypothetical predicted protein, partial [Paramuricea clavata]